MNSLTIPILINIASFFIAIIVFWFKLGMELGALRHEITALRELTGEKVSGLRRELDVLRTEVTQCQQRDASSHTEFRTALNSERK